MKEIKIGQTVKTNNKLDNTSYAKYKNQKVEIKDIKEVFGQKIYAFQPDGDNEGGDDGYIWLGSVSIDKTRV